MQNALKFAGMSFQAAARASRDTCSDLMHVSKAPVVNDLSPIISALAFARVSHAFLMSMLGRLLSFAIVANVVKTTTAVERAIVDFGIMFFSYLCECLRGLSHCRPLHSITSSASANSLSGMASPSALAVLRLITRSNLAGCITGRSAGFSPLRIRPVYIPAWR
jgi:hypothetical protein